MQCSKDSLISDSLFFTSSLKRNLLKRNLLERNLLERNLFNLRILFNLITYRFSPFLSNQNFSMWKQFRIENTKSLLKIAVTTKVHIDWDHNDSRIFLPPCTFRIVCTLNLIHFGQFYIIVKKYMSKCRLWLQTKLFRVSVSVHCCFYISITSVYYENPISLKSCKWTGQSSSA